MGTILREREVMIERDGRTGKIICALMPISLITKVCGVEGSKR